MESARKWAGWLGIGVDIWGLLLQPILGIDLVGYLSGYLANVVTQLLVPFVVGTAIIVWSKWEWINGKWEKFPVRIRRSSAVVVIVLLLLSGWLPQIQDELLGKRAGMLIEEKWMSEADTEKFIQEKLLRETNRNVFPIRVRMLIKYYLARGKIGTQYQCPDDSAWSIFSYNHHNIDSTFHQWGWDGTRSLSHGTDCKLLFLTENVYILDWVKLDSLLDPTTPNPGM